MLAQLAPYIAGDRPRSKHTLSPPEAVYEKEQREMWSGLVEAHGNAGLKGISTVISEAKDAVSYAMLGLPALLSRYADVAVTCEEQKAEIEQLRIRVVDLQRVHVHMTTLTKEKDEAVNLADAMKKQLACYRQQADAGLQELDAAIVGVKATEDAKKPAALPTPQPGVLFEAPASQTFGAMPPGPNRLNGFSSVVDALAAKKKSVFWN